MSPSNHLDHTANTELGLDRQRHTQPIWATIAGETGGILDVLAINRKEAKHERAKDARHVDGFISFDNLTVERHNTLVEGLTRFVV